MKSVKEFYVSFIFFFFFVPVINAQISTNWLNYTSNSSIVSFLGDGSTLWIGISWGGAIKYNLLDGSYTKYTVRDGLTTSNVNRFAKSPYDGRIWMCGSRSCGISEFYGSQWVKHTFGGQPYASNDISFNGIVCSDPGTVYVGLYKYFNNAFTYLSSELSSVNNMKKDNSVNIWYVGSKVAKLSGGAFTYFDTLNSGIAANATNDLAFDNNWNIWFAHDGKGLSYFNQSNSQWTKYDTLNSGLYSNSITKITVDNQNNLWGIVYSNRQKKFLIIRYDGSSWYHYDSTNVPLLATEQAPSSIYYNSYDTSIYIGTTKYWNRYTGLQDGGGKVLKFKNNQWSLFKNFNENDIPLWGPDDIVKDKNGRIILGSNFGGISIFDANQWTTYNHNNAPFINEQVDKVTIGKDLNLWAYISGYSISGSGWSKVVPASLMNYNNNIWTRYDENLILIDSIKIKDVSDCRIDTSNNLWLATRKGLLKKNGNSWIKYDSINPGFVSNNIRELKIDKHNNLWFACGATITKFNGTIVTTYDTPANLSFDVDSLGIIWTIGPPSNKNVYKYYNGNWLSTQMPTSSGGPTCIAIDRQTNYAWVGSYCEGVKKTNMTTWEHYLPKNSGINSLFIDNIYVDKNNNKYFYGSNGSQLSIFNENGITGINEFTGEVSDFNLYQNYPNPFNPNTKINYGLPQEGKVKLVIYDVLGREIKTLVNEVKQAGRYTVEFNGTQFASGVYFYRLQVEGGKTYTTVKKMVLLK